MSHNQPNEFVPYLSVSDAKAAVEFYSRVFQIPPFASLNTPDGRIMHCEFRFGSSRFYVSEELPEHGGSPSPKTLGATTVAIHLYVDDCDVLLKSMADNGAEVLMSATDMFWGERFARVRDPFGHEWGIATVIREMSPDEIQTEADQMFGESPK